MRVAELRGHDGGVQCLGSHPRSSVVASGGWSGVVLLHDVGVGSFQEGGTAAPSKRRLVQLEAVGKLDSVSG